MKRLIANKLHQVKFDLVPGFPVSLQDLFRFHDRLLGSATPLSLYGRWRKLLGNLVSQELSTKAGLADTKDRSPGKFDRQIMVIQSLRNVLETRIAGAVAEFGCFRGLTALQMAETMRKMGDSSKFYLFDSFEGFPEISQKEDQAWKKGQLAANYDEVRKRFSVYSNVEVVKGFFSDSLQHCAEPYFKFAHIDADLYTSIKEVNAWLFPRVVPGAVLIYDDYGFYTCEGALKAVDEDMKGRGFFGIYIPTGQYVAVKGK